MDEPSAKHDHELLEFPEGFLWGAATSAHQVEGGNTNNDWWEAEAAGKIKNKSGQNLFASDKATDQYNRFEEDFDLAKSLGHNTHRLSIEWSRIEAENGKFSDEAIEHYKQVLKALKDRNLKVILTLHHFTSPIWFSKIGGWESIRAPFYFERFVKKIVPELNEYVDLWVTLNEPGIYVGMGYLGGDEIGPWPPAKKSKLSALKVYWNLARAHKLAYKTIHKIEKGAKVGMAQQAFSFNAFHNHSLREQLTVWILDLLTNHSFYILSGKKNHDFLGINYYRNINISFNGEGKRLPSIIDISITKKDVSDLGWEIYPEGIFDVIMDYSDYHKDIYITENGIASTNDDRRVRFLLSYLKGIYHAIAAGAHVKGYLYWSLTDNFEWGRGFAPRFGLIDIDYEKSQKRTPRPSAYVYKEIIKQNGIPHKLLKLLGHGIQVEEVVKTK